MKKFFLKVWRAWEKSQMERAKRVVQRYKAMGYGRNLEWMD